MKMNLVKQNTRKNNKNYKKIKRKSIKNKPMTGGKPKVSFPYTYFILYYDNFIQYFNTLNPYLLAQTNACDSIALGKQPEYKYNEGVSFLNDNNEVCILVLKYDDAFILTKNLNFFNDIGFLNKILGHAKLKYYDSQSLLGIYNVCLHVFNISITPQGNIISQQKHYEPGYGTVLFNCIKTSVSFLPFQFDKMWLGIDINNVQFQKLAWLYASKGFEDPIFSNISPDGTLLPFYFIQLISKRDTYINNKDDALIPFFETIDLYNQIKTPLGQEGIFKLKFNFDKSAILSLRLMPFLSFSETKETVGINDYNMQRETTGRFLNYKSFQSNGDIINKLSLEVLTQKSMIKYDIGELSNVPCIEGQKVFHTHPFVNYKINNTLIAPPSSCDLSVFIQIILKSMQTPMSKIQQFGTVVAIEGLYIYSLSINGIQYLKRGQMLNPNDIKMYEYPFTERYYDWSTYATDTTIQVDTVNNELKKYFNWFENVNKKFGDYFKMDFKPWNDINENTEFEVHYYNGNRANIVPISQVQIPEIESPVEMDFYNNYHERPDIIDDTILKKQRIKGGKKYKKQKK
jgi:hypothetical protein